MSTLAVTYLVYLGISVWITVWVGHKLHRHGRPFLVVVFSGDERTADAVNHLLLTGYYITNIALDLFLLRSPLKVEGWLEATELLSGKLGVVMSVLGVMHFINVGVLLAVHRWRRTGSPCIAGAEPNSVVVLDVVEFIDEPQ